MTAWPGKNCVWKTIGPPPFSKKVGGICKTKSKGVAEPSKLSYSFHICSSDRSTFSPPGYGKREKKGWEMCIGQIIPQGHQDGENGFSREKWMELESKVGNWMWFASPHRHSMIFLFWLSHHFVLKFHKILHSVPQDFIENALARSCERFYVRDRLEKSLKLHRSVLEFCPSSWNKLSVSQCPHLKNGANDCTFLVGRQKTIRKDRSERRLLHAASTCSSNSVIWTDVHDHILERFRVYEMVSCLLVPHWEACGSCSLLREALFLPLRWMTLLCLLRQLILLLQPHLGPCLLKACDVRVWEWSWRGAKRCKDDPSRTSVKWKSLLFTSVVQRGSNTDSNVFLVSWSGDGV